MEKQNSFNNLLDIIKKLRSPDGCPWDREQTPASLKTHIREECHELIEAIIKNDNDEIMEECGDLLFQVLFIANLYEEKSHFSIEDVIDGISSKMISRHPHVFNNLKIKNVDEVLKNWEIIKSKEKTKKERESILDGIPSSLPALTRAYNMQKRAARVGFDWKKTKKTLDKIREEIDELEHEIKHNDTEKIKSEIGDLLFSLVNFSRHLDIDPESSLIQTIHKFSNRFKYIEEKVSSNGKNLADTSLTEMDTLWNEAKKLSSN